MQYEYALYVGYTIVRTANPRALIFFCALQWLVTMKGNLTCVKRERECSLYSKYTAAWDSNHNEILIPTWIQYLWQSIRWILLHENLNITWTDDEQCHHYKTSISSLLAARRRTQFLPPTQICLGKFRRETHVRRAHRCFSIGETNILDSKAFYKLNNIIYKVWHLT